MNITFFLGFAKAVKVEDLPFLINWCGPNVKSMVVDDKACLTSLVNMIAAIDDLQPDIDGTSFDPILAQSLFIITNTLISQLHLKFLKYSTRTLKSPKWEIDCTGTYFHESKIPRMEGLIIMNCFA